MIQQERYDSRSFPSGSYKKYFLNSVTSVKFVLVKKDFLWFWYPNFFSFYLLAIHQNRCDGWRNEVDGVVQWTARTNSARISQSLRSIVHQFESIHLTFSIHSLLYVLFHHQFHRPHELMIHALITHGCDEYWYQVPRRWFWHEY